MAKFYCRIKNWIRKLTPNKNHHTRPLQNSLAPESTIIAFDIHGVLFKKDYKKIARLMWHNKKDLSPLLLYTFNPFFIYDIFKLRYKKAITEEYIIGLGTKYPRLTKLIPLGITLANAQKPISQTISIVKNLKKRGYVLHVFSNIGKTIYADLAKQFPEILNTFDALITTTAKNNYKNKSHKDFFYSYISQHTPKKQLILIDNTYSNIKQAHTLGIIGIRFTTPQALQKTLSRLL